MNAKRAATRAVLWLLTLFLAVLTVFPVYYMIVMSITPTNVILANRVNLLPQGFYPGNLIRAFQDIPLLRQLFNTALVSLATLAFQLVTCSMAAYAFAFLEFKGKKILFLLVLSTMMVPDMTIIIANYLSISSWNWLDTYQALILPYATSALGIFLFRQFYLTMAKEIREAAALDGASDLYFLVHIAAPLSKPIMAAFGVTSFLGTWNMYLWPLLVTNSASMRMVQVGIASLQDRDSTLGVGIALAGAAVVTLPSLILFVFGHRQLVTGMMAGAVKE